MLRDLEKDGAGGAEQRRPPQYSLRPVGSAVDAVEPRVGERPEPYWPTAESPAWGRVAAWLPASP